MKTEFLTIEEIDEAIASQEKAKESAIQQANFHAGYIACLKEIKTRMDAKEDEAPPAGGNLLPIKPAAKKARK